MGELGNMALGTATKMAQEALNSKEKNLRILMTQWENLVIWH